MEIGLGQHCTNCPRPERGTKGPQNRRICRKQLPIIQVFAIRYPLVAEFCASRVQIRIVDYVNYVYDIVNLEPIIMFEYGISRQVSAIRAFNRFYTRRIGVVDGKASSWFGRVSRSVSAAAIASSFLSCSIRISGSAA